MHLILFGDGWGGEHRDVAPEDIFQERGVRYYNFIPHVRQPRLRPAKFTVKEYQCERNGEMYMIGFSGQEPLMPDVEHAILHNRPDPI